MSTPSPAARPARTAAAAAAAMLLSALAIAGAFAVLAADRALRTSLPVGDDVTVSVIAAGTAVLCLGWLRLRASGTA